VHGNDPLPRYRRGVALCIVAATITLSTAGFVYALDYGPPEEKDVMWEQNYNPLGNAALSTLAAAVPLITLLMLIASGRMKTHIAALIALVVANIVAIVIFAMPAHMSVSASLFGAVSGLFPVGWALLNLVFFYQVTVTTRRFDFLRRAIFVLTADRRLQLLLVAFTFGAFMEGASGFGIAVTIAAVILTGLGFSPLAASGLSLIANSAAAAYSAQGAPIQTIRSMMALDPFVLGAMVGRQVPFLSLLVPFWLIWAFAGWRGMTAIWPAILVTGASFAVAQFAISNFVNPWIVNIGASLISMSCLILLLRVWQPKQVWTSAVLRGTKESAAPLQPAKPFSTIRLSRSQLWSALLPWIIVCIVMLIWGSAGFNAWANSTFAWSFEIPGIYNTIGRLPPFVPCMPDEATRACKPVLYGMRYAFTYLSFTGTGLLFAAIVAGLLMGLPPAKMVAEYGRTLKRCAIPLIAVSAVVATGTLSWLSGIDATLGLAFAATGPFHPFFGSLLGWAGVVLGGSGVASNALFGNLQKVISDQLGLSPVLMGAANTSGGAMGEMMDVQSIIFTSTASNAYGHEGSILRFVVLHSIVLACLVGVLVTLQAYVYPFTLLVLK
jgi:lactate permease